MSQPVMPIDEYCKALKTWADLTIKQRKADKLDVPTAGVDLSHWSEHLSQVFLNIRKSNLLYRMLYCGEKKPRERQCPIHKGRWSGIECAAGCGGCGWLPDCDKCDGRGWTPPHHILDGLGGATQAPFEFCECSTGQALKHHVSNNLSKLALPVPSVPR